MTGLRAIKDEMRRDLHREAAIPALFVASEAAEPLAVDVRVHKSMVKIGDGEDASAVSHSDISPRAIFLRDQVAMPPRGAIISVAAGEAYSVGNTLPPDGITITAMVAQMTQAQIDKRFPSGQPVPEASE